jgi:pilus assembly protein CpaF
MELNVLKSAFQKIRSDQNSILAQDVNLDSGVNLKNETLLNNLNQSLSQFDIEIRERILNELEGFGPITSLIQDPEVTEILINQHDQIFYEKFGLLSQHTDCFFDIESYHVFIEMLVNSCRTYINTEKPFVEFQKDFIRYTIIAPDISRGEYLVSLRKQPFGLWTFNELKKTDWAKNSEFDILEKLILERKNFLVVGGTGSGKTSFLQAAIHKIGQNQRLIMIEDTQELRPVYPLNTSLLTRSDPTRKMVDITMNDLIKKSLRLRPDRICIGEIRGEEATALLMALATGHEGSFGSIHAKTAHEALLRLEMLIQMGAPQWSIQSIRRLIGLTIQNIIVVEKKDGQRKLSKIYQITSVEESGITLHCLNEE